MNWTQGPLLSFDTETTGINIWQDRLVTASLVELGPDGAVTTHSWLVDPGVEIPAGAAAIHGVTTEKARAEGVPPAEALEEMTALLADWMGRDLPVVVFNAPFDFTLLEVENRRHGVTALKERLGRAIGPVVDPLVVDKRIFKFRRGKRTLVDLAVVYGVDLTDAHTSDADALAAARLVAKMDEAQPMIGQQTPAAFHDLQATWFTEQSEDFARYLAEQGSQARANGVLKQKWPIG